MRSRFWFCVNSKMVIKSGAVYLADSDKTIFILYSPEYSAGRKHELACSPFTVNDSMLPPFPYTDTLSAMFFMRIPLKLALVIPWGRNGESCIPFDVILNPNRPLNIKRRKPVALHVCFCSDFQRTIPLWSFSCNPPYISPVSGWYISAK